MEEITKEDRKILGKAEEKKKEKTGKIEGVGWKQMKIRESILVIKEHRWLWYLLMKGWWESTREITWQIRGIKRYKIKKRKIYYNERIKIIKMEMAGVGKWSRKKDNIDKRYFIEISESIMEKIKMMIDEGEIEEIEKWTTKV